jgi:tubulin--tyrosine ligase
MSDSEDGKGNEEDDTPATVSKHLLMYNRIERNYHLSDKRTLSENMSVYYKSLDKDPFDYLPVTYVVEKGLGDKNFKEFLNKFTESSAESQYSIALEEASPMFFGRKLKGTWIIKPGENSNRGYGIFVTNSLSEIKKRIEESANSVIIQMYIERPLLINKRKFDIRLFGLL